MMACEMLGDKFQRDEQLRAHFCSRMPFKCSFCDKTFKSESLLRKHSPTHSSEKPYKCSDCPMAFKRLHELNIHTNIHTKIWRYTCDICSEDFWERRKLLNHKRRSHAEGFDRSCKVCGKGFHAGGGLSEHMKTHLGLRPAQCELCGRTFRNGYLLRVHKLKHDAAFEPTRFVCEHCGTVYSSRQGFGRHLRAHTHGAAQFLCSSCGKTVTSLASLRKHSKIHEEEEEEDSLFGSCSSSVLNNFCSALEANSGQLRLSTSTSVGDVYI